MAACLFTLEPEAPLSHLVLTPGSLSLPDALLPVSASATLDGRTAAGPCPQNSPPSPGRRRHVTAHLCKCGGHLQCSRGHLEARGPLEDPWGTGGKLCATLSNLDAFRGLSIPGSVLPFHTCPQTSKSTDGRSCRDTTLLPHSGRRALRAESDFWLVPHAVPPLTQAPLPVLGTTVLSLMAWPLQEAAASKHEECTALNRMSRTSAGFLPNHRNT